MISNQRKYVNKAKKRYQKSLRNQHLINYP